MSDKEKGESLNERHPYIAVVGPIGVGKTSFTSALTEYLKTPSIKEPYEDNPYLNGFYTKNPKDYSFNCQMYFMMMDGRCVQRASKELPSVPILQDGGRTTNSIIQTVQWKMGFMTDDQCEVYTKIYANVYRGLPQPDIYVAAKARTETVIDRIVKREREKELIMLKRFPDYFPMVVEEFNEWLSTARKIYDNVIVIDTDDPKFSPENYKDSLLQVLGGSLETPA